MKKLATLPEELIREPVPLVELETVKKKLLLQYQDSVFYLGLQYQASVFYLGLMYM